MLLAAHACPPTLQLSVLGGENTGLFAASNVFRVSVSSVSYAKRAPNGNVLTRYNTPRVTDAPPGTEKPRRSPPSYAHLPLRTTKSVCARPRADPSAKALNGELCTASPPDASAAQATEQHPGAAPGRRVGLLRGAAGESAVTKNRLRSPPRRGRQARPSGPGRPQ